MILQLCVLSTEVIHWPPLLLSPEVLPCCWARGKALLIMSLSMDGRPWKDCKILLSPILRSTSLPSQETDSENIYLLQNKYPTSIPRSTSGPHVQRRGGRADADHLEQEQRCFVEWLANSIKVAVWGTLQGPQGIRREVPSQGLKLASMLMGNSTTIHDF